MKKTISISRSIRMVHLLAVILFAGGTFADWEPYCPPGDIFPCTCIVRGNEDQVFCNDITSLGPVLPILERHFHLEIARLFLTHFHSSSLPSVALGRFMVTQLEVLDGDISQIDKDAFMEQKDSIKSIHLDRNRLEDVPTEALQQLTSLWRLSLSGNRLKRIRNGTLNYSDNLIRLNLSGNLISEIDQTAFPGQLYELDLSGNSLSTFNGSIKSLKSLSKLIASHNELTSIKGEFDNDRLRWLTLDFNQISDISELSKLFSLQTLSLAGNRIQNVSISGLDRLQELNLAQNSIRYIPRKVFKNMNQLYHLDLSGNLLQSIEFCPTVTPSGTVCNYENLRFVDLSHNQLSVLSLPGATALETVDISFNNFRSVYNVHIPQDRTASLMMEGNPTCRSERRPARSSLTEKEL